MSAIVDLTRTLEDGQPGVEFEPKFTVENNGWNARTLHLYSHTGTHMDAPLHFGVSNETIEQISLERLLVPGHICEIAVTEPNQLLTIDDLAEVAGKIQPGHAVLLKTGWSQHFDKFEYYRDNLPRISEPLAHWLVQARIGIVGVESHSVADVNDLAEVTLIHQILLGGNIIIVEGLTGLDGISSDRFLFGAMPLKIGGGDGTPCRAFALLDD